MAERFEPHATLHSQGIAVGWSGRKNDSLVFKFYEERFEFPTVKVFPLAQWNGYFYTAKVKELRALQKQNK